MSAYPDMMATRELGHLCMQEYL